MLQASQLRRHGDSRLLRQRAQLVIGVPRNGNTDGLGRCIREFIGMGRADDHRMRAAGDSAAAAQIVIDGIGYGRMGVHEIIVLLIYAGSGGCHCRLISPAAHHFLSDPFHHLRGYRIDAFLLQFTHSLCRGLGPCHVIQEPLKVRGNQNIHGRRLRQMEFSSAVIGAGGKEVAQHVILIGRAHQLSDGRTDLSCDPGCQNIAEIAGGHHHIERFLLSDGAAPHQRQPDPHIIGHLREQTADIDGIGAGEDHRIAAFLRRQRRGENFLHGTLSIIKIAFNAAYPHISAFLLLHLVFLERAHAVGRIKYADIHAFHVAEAFQCRFPGITGRRREDQYPPRFSCFLFGPG